MYANFLLSSVQDLRFLFRKPSVEEAFAVIFEMWGSHLRSSDKMTPRYGFSETCFSICPHN